MKPGKVYLVGAGPGDPELLTLKAAKAIAIAEVIFVDDLVNPAVLAHAHAQARVVRVGKRGGCRSTPQALIERLMIREARAGRTVVRLKGGDPCMFGRAGEERDALQSAGIDVEWVAGITAGMAAPAACGIPTTHRAVAPGVIFVTGHLREDGSPNWQALAATGLTLVIYMGAARAREIARALIEGGLAATTETAIVTDATLTTQSMFVMTVRELASLPREITIESPSIIVVGDIVRYRAAAPVPVARRYG